MDIVPSAIVQALFLALIVNRVIEYVKKPILMKWPDLDLWWLIYVAWVCGAALSFLSGLNLVESVFPDPFVGKMLTAVIVGGGANLINDIFNTGPVW